MSSTKNKYYMDLHIHIGRTRSGRPVKITASNQLTLSNVLEESLVRKGLSIVGVIDSHSPEVLEELEELLDTGYARELTGGGLSYLDQITLILGTELEIYDENSIGPIHVLCFFPTIELMTVFSNWCKTRMKNIHLSSQRIYVSGKELQKQVLALNGWFIPAHVFTPFKSLFGKGVNISLEEVFDFNDIHAMELGLSSNTQMAEKLLEMQYFPFLTNSDAHSTAKIGREHQIVQLNEPSFKELTLALKNEADRGIIRNIGLDPRLGKYYRTICKVCETQAVNGECPNGHDQTKIIKGVSERIDDLALKQSSLVMNKRKEEKVIHPPYIHQVPLDFIPGCGAKTMDKLLSNFQTEMKILHEVSGEELLAVVPENIANKILAARAGKLMIKEGGAGKYGKIN